MCWDVNKKRQCKTLPREEAYALRKKIEEEGGCTWWFQPIP